MTAVRGLVFYGQLNEIGWVGPEHTYKPRLEGCRISEERAYKRVYYSTLMQTMYMVCYLCFHTRDQSC